MNVVPKPKQLIRRPPVSFNFMMLSLLFVGSGVLAFMGTLPDSPIVFVFVMSGWIVSLCLHEFGHALAGFRGGDYTVADKGYLALDPVHYLDPFLSLILPAVYLILGGFAFPGGCVYIQRNLLRSREWDAIVSAAGPLANLLFLVVLLLPFWLGLPESIEADQFWGGVAFLALLQLISLVINLLPIPGLDGYGVIRPFLSWETQARFAPMERYGVLFLFMLFYAVDPFTRAFFDVIYSISNFIGLDGIWIGAGMRDFYFWQ